MIISFNCIIFFLDLDAYESFLVDVMLTNLTYIILNFNYLIVKLKVVIE